MANNEKVENLFKSVRSRGYWALISTRRRAFYGDKDARALLREVIRYGDGPQSKDANIEELSKEQEEIIADLKSRAGKGDALAAVTIAENYLYGLDVSQNRGKAAGYLAPYVEKDDPACLFQMGLIYYYDMEYDEAVALWQRGVDIGSPSCMTCLARHYLGKPSGSEYTRAYELLSQAEIKNYVPALAELSLCCFFGLGTEQDRTEAIRLLYKADKKKDADAWVILREWTYGHPIWSNGGELSPDQRNKYAPKGSAVFKPSAISPPPTSMPETTDADGPLDGLVGLDSVKAQIQKVADRMKLANLRQEQGLKSNSFSKHMVFTGNPGTGKTTVARILAQMYRRAGLVPKGHLVEVAPQDILSVHVSGSVEEFEKVFEQARGGVLFIDEAYGLLDNRHGSEVITALTRAAEEHRDDTAIILAGYQKEMAQFLSANPGLESRFGSVLHFRDYTPEELVGIYNSFCREQGFTLGPGAQDKLAEIISKKHAPRNSVSGNGRYVRNLFEDTIMNMSQRVAGTGGVVDRMALSMIEAEDLPQDRKQADGDLEKNLDLLNDLVGLESIKREVREIVARIRIDSVRSQRGMQTGELSRHFVFSGNPGTGKTTVARILGAILKSVGLLDKGHVVETSPSELIGEYIGQTQKRVREAVQAALGGVLFIDEAYGFVNTPKYGPDAVNALVKEMEDHRHDLVVIAAGYPEDIKGLLKSNPGLESRFNTHLTFETFTPDELVQIFYGFCTRAGYVLGEGAENNLSTVISAGLDKFDEAHFGNGRFVRNVFDAAITRQASRLLSDPDLDDTELVTLLPEDIPTIDDLDLISEKKQRIGFL